jgi:hypothetical protein
MPEPLHANALVRCRRCGGALDRWSTLQERAAQIVLAEARTRGLAPECLSADPLPA